MTEPQKGEETNQSASSVPEEVQSWRAGVQNISEKLDEHQKFQLFQDMEFLKRFSELLDRESQFFEKMILFDSTAIALSVTFLTALSGHSRLTAHGSTYPLLQLLGVSWLLFLMSIVLSGVCILSRTHAAYSEYLDTKGEYFGYIRRRVSKLAQEAGSLIKFESPVEAKRVFKLFGLDIPDLFSKVSEYEQKAGEVESKHAKDKASDERSVSNATFAFRSAVVFTIGAVVLLCIFVYQAIPMLFN